MYQQLRLQICSFILEEEMEGIYLLQMQPWIIITRNYTIVHNA
jgi:hypothetical protein